MLKNLEKSTIVKLFVQLIGIYNEAEFNLMFGNVDAQADKKPVHFILSCLQICA